MQRAYDCAQEVENAPYGWDVGEERNPPYNLYMHTHPYTHGARG